MVAPFRLQRKAKPSFPGPLGIARPSESRSSNRPSGCQPHAKVFGIGFHKTGTTSLCQALEVLGYDVLDPIGVHEEDIAQTTLSRALQCVPDHDAFQDSPWPILFRELDERFPGSRFILTTRDTQSWIASITRHFGGERTPMRRWIYGVGDPLGAEERYAEVYDAHNAAVRAHFAQRPDDLLELDFAHEDGWPKLCAFLGVPAPREPFIHANRAQIRDSFLRRLLSRWR